MSSLPHFFLIASNAGFQLSRLLHVERHVDRRIHLLDERIDITLRLFAVVGNCEIGPERVEGLGAPPCDRLIVSDTGDERFLTLEHRQRG